MNNPLVPERYSRLGWGTSMIVDAANALNDLGDAAMKAEQFRDAEQAFDMAASLYHMALRHTGRDKARTSTVLTEGWKALRAKAEEAIQRDEAARQ